MKKLIVYSLTAVMSLGLSSGAFAADKKAKGTTTAPAAAPADTKKAEDKPAVDKTQRPLPMYTRVDSVDAAGKTFTMKRRDGVEVKHVVTDKTEFVAPAKFEDIKVGEYVSGSRIKKGDSEYDVVKVTKIGPPKEKAAKTGTAEKPADTVKPAEKKP